MYATRVAYIGGVKTRMAQAPDQCMRSSELQRGLTPDLRAVFTEEGEKEEEDGS
jgi:hypothetical protein